MSEVYYPIDGLFHADCCLAVRVLLLLSAALLGKAPRQSSLNERSVWISLRSDRYLVLTASAVVVVAASAALQTVHRSVFQSLLPTRHTGRSPQ